MESTVYQGTLSDIINKLSNELAEAMGLRHENVTGVHVLALLSIIISLANGSSGATILGTMPSFKTMLSSLTRGMTGSKWSETEYRAFEKEFCEIIESSGGYKLGPASPQQTPYMAPMSKEVH
mgnify:CR=1 FL=1